MLKACSIFYGQEKVTVEVPEQNLIGVIEPREVDIPQDEMAIMQDAILNPIGLPPLRELALPGQRVAIVVDDNTRPTPTGKMLPLILAELEQAGVRDEDITIVFALGAHRQQTPEEQSQLVGAEAIARYHVCDHNCYDQSQLSYLGNTTSGIPVRVNHFVARADLRILTGLIKPHCQAGYSGGGKAILPGVSSIETIIADHNYEAIIHPKAIYGVIDGNPMRSTIEDAAQLLAPCFIMNVILDRDKHIVGAVAGDMIKAHRAGVRELDRFVRVPVPEVADIIVAGCSHPSSVNMYQAASAATICTRLIRPIVKRGGVIIVAAPCPEGISDGPFYQLVREAATAQDVIDKVAQPGFFMHDQWEAQLWATVLTYCHIYFVTDGVTSGQVREMKADPYPTVDDALQAALSEQGSDSRILVVPDAPYTIPELVADRAAIQKGLPS